MDVDGQGFMGNFDANYSNYRELKTVFGIRVNS